MEATSGEDYGVPQNRPRVIMIGIREDVHAQLPDAIKENMQDSFYPPKTNGAPDLIDVLGDLVDENHVRSGGSTNTYPREADPKNKYQKELREKTREGAIAKKGDPLTEHDYSNHSQQVIQKYKRIHKSGKSLLGVEQKRRLMKDVSVISNTKIHIQKKIMSRFAADFAPQLKKADERSG